ncbi:hypothetical protein MASR1M45_15500 [Candidatus Kapaibacterium sp.]
MKYKIELKWAAGFAIMSMLWMLLERIVGLHSSNIDKHAVYTNFVAIPAILIYVFAFLDKQRSFYPDGISFKDGIIFGLFMTLFITLISPVNILITLYVITPDFFNNAIEYAVKSGNMTQATAQDYFNTGSYIMQGLIGAPIMGIITTVLVNSGIFAFNKYRK